MPRVLFVSKPIAPPFHDGTKCLVRDVAAALRELSPVVLTTREGLSLLPPGVEGRAVYGGSGSFAPALADNARAAFALLTGPRDDLWHFVFAPNARTGQVARLLKRARRLPIVQTVASPPRHFTGLSRLIFGDELVVQSRATAASLAAAASAERFELPPVTVIPPPVAAISRPSEDAVRQARAELGLRDADRIVLYPGDLEVSSGAEISQALVTPLTERFPDAVVVFAYRNKTPHAAERAARLRRLLEGKQVRITDRVSSMHALLAASRVVIFPVDDLWGKVDQPIVLLEALSLGVPCAVLDRGPLRDVVGAAKVTSVDARVWLDAVTPLFADGPARRAAEAEGRDAASRVYASGVVARAYEAIYLRALAGARTNAS
ncbi:MAG: glycosyltransferase family 1 protein [Myxococcales bacterium]|nr:MAG: glycosyltransferase family 1 protein [Myxococcales bacterium]